ncbi:hypothetical protein ERJ75_000251700 [Trypanosoma vivax]|nr:hypothetical protein ERJ75_000251700 [Trypanosoma vivax]
MSTQLASQLQQLQQRPVGDKRLTKSFLFTDGEARSFSREQVHELAVHGLGTLVAIDNRFHPFIERLFDAGATRVERKQLSADSNAELNETIEQFLTLLSPHLFLTAAHQVFEYLVRVHEVHVFNVQAVLRAFMPYHDHALFSRALLLLDLRDTGFGFLEQNQENGAPLLREQLVQACAVSRKALRLVCLTLAMAARMRVHNSAANALFAGVAVKLASYPRAEPLWRVLLPFVVEFMSGEVLGEGECMHEPEEDRCLRNGLSNGVSAFPSREVICTALVVLAAWCSETQLSLSTLLVVLKPIVRILTKSAPESVSATVPVSHFLAVLNLLFQTQRHAVTQVTFNLQIEALLGLPWKRWTPTLSDMGAGMCDSLISILLRHCLQRLRASRSMHSVSPDVLHFVQCAVEDMPLTDTLVAETVQTLVACSTSDASPREAGTDEALGKRKGGSSRKGGKTSSSAVVMSARTNAREDATTGGVKCPLNTWINALERRFPIVFDSCLSKLLNDTSTQLAATSFLTQHLSGTRYEVLEVCGLSGAAEHLPLFSCMFHPLSEVRLVAARRLQEMTVEQLTCSSVAHNDGDHGRGSGNSLLELLVHVAQYESSPAVAEEFLRAAAVSAKGLMNLLLPANCDDAECVLSHAAPRCEKGVRQAPTPQQCTTLGQLRELLSSHWIMVNGAHGRAPLQMGFLNLLLLPLLDELHQLCGAPPRLQKKTMKDLGISVEGVRSMKQSVHGLFMYYLTLQYVYAVDGRSRVIKSCAVAGSTSNGQVEAEFTKLVLELERRLISEIPCFDRSSSLFAATAHRSSFTRPVASEQAAGPERDVEKKESQVAKSAGRSDTEKEQCVAGDVNKQGDAECLAVYQCIPLLRMLHGEASLRFQPALLEVMRGRLFGENISPVTVAATVECCMACTCLLSTGDLVEVNDVIRALYCFFVGEDSFPGQGSGLRASEAAGGYLVGLQESQRKNSRGMEKEVGRGVQNALSMSFVPQDDFTKLMGTAVRFGMEQCMLRESAVPNGGSNNCAPIDRDHAKRDGSPDVITSLVHMARLLGYLCTPLFPITVSLTQLPSAYMRLLVEEEDGDHPDSSPARRKRLPVDWFGMVYSAVFHAPNHEKALSSNPTSHHFSLSALSLVILLPLVAPTSRRDVVLRELQSAILTASGGKRSSTSRASTASGAMVTLEAARQGEHVSVTALSAIVEAMAVEGSQAALTREAADLLCRMIANEECAEVCEGGSIPFTLSLRIVEHFFPVRGSDGAKKPGRAGIAVSTLLPLFRKILEAGGRGGGAGAVTVSRSAADLLHAVCVRSGLGVSRKRLEKAEEREELDALLQLCLLLVRYPFLHIVGGRVQAVYRHALTVFANVLSHGVERHVANPVLFVPAVQKDVTSSLGSVTESEEYVRRVSMTVFDVLFGSGARAAHLGTDVLRLLVGTVGGYHRLFAPLVVQKSEEPLPDLSMIVDALETLVSTSSFSKAKRLQLVCSRNEGGEADAWEPPQWCTLHNSLTYNDVQMLLGLCSKWMNVSSDGQRLWKRESGSLHALRLLSCILQISSSIRFENGAAEEENEEDDNSNSDVSLFALVRKLLESFPLVSLVPLLVETGHEGVAGARANDKESFHRSAMSLVRAVVDLCISSSWSLNDGQRGGSAHIRRAVVKQSITLMATLLVPKDALMEEETDVPQDELHPECIGIIRELLHIVAPLFTMNESTARGVGGGEATPGNHNGAAIHIPVIALLIRLGSITQSFPETQLENATQVCRNLMTSFDVHTQLACLTQMMYLLIDPHTHLSQHSSLSVSNNGVEWKRARKQENNINEDPGGSSVQACDVVNGSLFGRLVKPGQVINRQEEIMRLINYTVKSEEFLSGFLALQHGRTAPSSRPAPSNGICNEDDGKSTTSSGYGSTKTSAECMALLVSALELFVHYTELNAATQNDAVPITPENVVAGAEDGTIVYGETKAFVMLMELLAGNTLACVLAGINEPTFVSCIGRLITDSRVPLQLKGLEVLLDRLHHALPTVEHTLTDLEMEEHRRKLRDPKHKMTLMEVVRVKARPHVTRKSFALFQHLTALMSKVVGGNGEHSTVSRESRADLFRVLSLTTCCMEEIVRIVACGGSRSAERTLLNVHRSDRVKEETLFRVFGNKARVQQVHQWVENILSALSWLLPLSSRDVADSRGPLTIGETDGEFLSSASLLTALGTVCQVMGVAFTVPHSNAIIQKIVGAALYSTSAVSPVVSRSESGSVLRQAVLSCVLRVFPSCWLMCQPYVSRLVHAATHLNNVDDPETNYRSVEVMAMLEAVLGPQLFIEACAECLRGIQCTSMEDDGNHSGSKKPFRVRVGTHSFSLLYGSVHRCIGALKREELRLLSVLSEGATAQDNFWLASLNALSSTPSLPSPDTIQPVLEAYAVFFLKFKSKQCSRYVTTVAEWSFGGAAESFLKLTEQQEHLQSGRKKVQNADDRVDDDDDTHTRDDAAAVPRITVHRWLLFYALCNHLLERLGVIMDFAFPVVLPYIVGTLNNYCSSTQRGTRHISDLIARTLEGALNAVRQIAFAQTAPPDHDHSVPVENYLATPEVFNALMPAVVRQLTNLVYLADGIHDYLFRAEHHVIPAVRALFRSLTSTQQQSRTQRELVRTLRHPSRQVRRMALLCFDGIYEDGGGELAARLMAEMLPAVAELTEDKDDAVVEQARKLCVNLSTITGQDVLYAMSA